jgi:opacity protein-like surface antigen
VPAPIPVQEGFTYYFRADLNYGTPMNAPTFNENGYRFGNGPGVFTSLTPFTYGDPTFFGPLTTDTGDILGGTVGIGAYITRHLRGDITFDFRGKPGTDATSTYAYAAAPGGVLNGNTITGTVRDTFKTRSAVLMANGYIDLLPRGLFTPYIGAGVGFVYNDMDRTRVSIELEHAGGAGGALTGASQTLTTGGKETGVGLAAALMGGLSFAFDQRWVLDVNYRAQYLAGDSVEVTVVNAGAATQRSTGTVGDHWEHQVRVGVRFNMW